MMSFILDAISERFPSITSTNSISITSKLPTPSEKAPRSDKEVANEILNILSRATNNDSRLKSDLQSAVTTCGWKEGIAERILNGLQNALENGAPMGEAMKNAFERAVIEAYEFAKEHPVYFIVIALGILVILAPWALEALGFAEIGPVEGSFAALWQARYAGYVSKGSLFSFFQRLGMTGNWIKCVL